jgi:hypothetical protein
MKQPTINIQRTTNYQKSTSNIGERQHVEKLNVASLLGVVRWSLVVIIDPDMGHQNG